MSIENRFPHWLSSSISSYHSRRGQGLGVIVRCHHMSARTGHWDNVTCPHHLSPISPDSRHRETCQKCTVSDSALPPTVLNPCQYSCVCGMIPHFPGAPAGSTWLLVPPIQSRVPSVMFWLTSMSRRSPEYQVPHSALISFRLMTEAGARLLTWHSVMCHTQTLAALVSSLRNFPSWQWYNFPLFCPSLKTWQGHIQLERNILAQVWQLKMDSLLLSAWLYVVGYGLVSPGSHEPCRPGPWQSDQWKVAGVVCGQGKGREEMCNCWFQVMSGSNPVNMPLIICSADQTSRLSLAQFR